MLRRGGVDTRCRAICAATSAEARVQRPGNSLSALTRLDFGGLGSDPDLCELSAKVIREVLAIAAALGWDLHATIDVERVARRNNPGQRPSMLQDVLQGRPLEVEAHLGQLQAFARSAVCSARYRSAAAAVAARARPLAAEGLNVYSSSP